MAISSTQQEYFAFMAEYATFLEHMLDDERNKLLALQSKELPRIEQSIVTSQANAKQLENLETKRLHLQMKAGYNELSFLQILETQDKEELRVLRPLYDSFERNVREIRFFNTKSMAVAKDNMQHLKPGAVLPGVAGGEASTGNEPYSRLTQNPESSGGLLQTKV